VVVVVAVVGCGDATFGLSGDGSAPWSCGAKKAMPPSIPADSPSPSDSDEYDDEYELCDDNSLGAGNIEHSLIVSSEILKISSSSSNSSNSSLSLPLFAVLAVLVLVPVAAAIVDSGPLFHGVSADFFAAAVPALTAGGAESGINFAPAPVVVADAASEDAAAGGSGVDGVAVSVVVGGCETNYTRRSNPDFQYATLSFPRALSTHTRAGVNSWNSHDARELPPSDHASSTKSVTRRPCTSRMSTNPRRAAAAAAVAVVVVAAVVAPAALSLM
jgi:hypothetical protein